jgi:hypothetical protein
VERKSARDKLGADFMIAARLAADERSVSLLQQNEEFERDLKASLEFELQGPKPFNAEFAKSAKVDPKASRKGVRAGSGLPVGLSSDAEVGAGANAQGAGDGVGGARLRAEPSQPPPRRL